MQVQARPQREVDQGFALPSHERQWSKSKPPKKPPQLAIDRQQEFAKIEYDAKHGIKAAPQRARDLAGYLESYVDALSLTGAKGSTYALRIQVRRFIEFSKERGVTTVQGVNRAHCRDYLEWRLKTVKPTTIKSERGRLMGAWTRAVVDELIPSNPWENAKAPSKIAESVPTFWSSQEIASIARNCRRPWQTDLVLVMANTGLRVSTALAMEWSWIKWGPGYITIPQGIKNVKTSYSLNIGRVARTVLQRMHALGKGDRLVFPHPETGERISYITAKQAIQKAILKAGVPHGTPHDLRHSYGRAMALAGVPITVIQQQLGHTTLLMTMRYMTTGIEHSAKFIENFGVGEEPEVESANGTKPGAIGPLAAGHERPDQIDPIQPGLFDDRVGLGEGALPDPVAERVGSDPEQIRDDPVGDQPGEIVELSGG